MTDNNAAAAAAANTAENTAAQPRPRRRVFLPVTFLLILAVMFAGTFVLHFPTFRSEIGWVRANVAGSLPEQAEALVDRWTADAASNIFLQERLVELDGLAARFYDKHFVRDTEYSYSVIKDNHGWLQFITFPAQLREVVADIAAYKALGVPILYVQPPTKYIDGYTEFPPTLHDQTAANAANTKQAVLDAGVAYLDLREAAEADELDKEKLFYRTDHHWRVETAFWAAQQTAAELDELFGLGLLADPAYLDEANWRQTTWRQNFLGSQGRRVGRFYGGLDDFTLLEPDFATAFSVRLWQQTGEVTEKDGSFADALLEQSMLTDPDVYTNRYGAYWGADYPLATADNLNIEDGPTLLIIKDSYALPFGAFLAAAADKIYMVDLRYFDINNLSSYITEIAPDAVIIMYS